MTAEALLLQENISNENISTESSSNQKIRINKIFLPFTSRGIPQILFNLIYLKWKTRNQKGLFHITGDVHYAMLALPSKRTIVTIHDLVFLHSYKGITRKFLKWIFLDLPVNKARTITTISEKSRQEILQHSTCTPEKIRLIPNPVDPMLAAPNINPISTPVDQTQSTESTHHQPIINTIAHAIPRILFLGTSPNKNLDLTIAALYKLNIHLRIIGSITSNQQSLLKKFNIHYSTVQQLSAAELYSEYHNADLILFPSTYEGFGLPLIEGFQAGKPVITSNIAPMRDIAGSAAMLINPYSISSIRTGVQQVMEDVYLRKKMVEQGREIANNHAPQKIAAAYHQLWTHVWNSRHTAL